MFISIQSTSTVNSTPPIGALNIPADEVEQRAPQLLPDKNAVILLYCRTGKRADKALETLRKMGYSHVENLHRFEM